MGVASWLFGLLGPCSWVWAGRGCSCGGGGWLSCAVVRGGWLPCVGVEDTPVLLLLPVFVWGWGLVGAPVWGWHAVGVLGQCALVARPAFLLPFLLGVGVGVGGLVVNCIVDASILL